MPDERRIDITGLSKADVLRVLYDNSKPLGLGVPHFTAEKMSFSEALGLVGSGGEDAPSELRFDYLKGRVMKVDLSEDSFDPWGYDRDNGYGAAQAAIDELRRRGA